MIRTPQIPTLAEPKLIDLALLEIQTALTAKLPWLNHAFGKAQRLKEERDGRIVIYPGVYAGSEDYLEVFPDSHIGNFSFFDVDDGEEMNGMNRASIAFEAKIGLVVWFDYRKVYPGDWQQRSIENVKAEVIEALNTSAFRRSSVIFYKAWERSESIYKGYSDKEIMQQFLMRPYGGLKIEFFIKYQEKPNC
jgi:hypothetical protein